MSVYYLAYAITDPSILSAFKDKGFIVFSGNQIGYEWTERGRAIVDEFIQNVANLG
jgi:hypothetical protein